MRKIVGHSLWILVLTILTQLGGIAWITALGFKRRAAVFVLVYVGLSTTALVVAPTFGRVPLPCLGNGTAQMQSMMYCALNRQYVVPELAEVVNDLGDAMNAEFPGTTTLVLDGNFPFLTGFPLLPHLSHDDGRKVDLAFFYQDEGAFRDASTRSPIGYFAFEDGPTQCPRNWITLRWNMGWLQGLWPDFAPEPRRMAMMLRWLSNDPRVDKILLEPHLHLRFDASGPKVRFQGCRAARHDDHVHIQI